MKKSILRKIISEEIQKLKENSYDDFIDNNSDEIKDARSTIKKGQSVLAKLQKKYPEELPEKIMKKLDRIENIYDGENYESVEGWFMGNRIPSTRDIADIALYISNRHGTEMRMVLNCIVDFYNAIT